MPLRGDSARDFGASMWGRAGAGHGRPHSSHEAGRRGPVVYRSALRYLPPSGRLSPELLVNRRPEPSPTIFGELLGHFSPRGESLRKGHRLREYHVAFVLLLIFPIYPVILSSSRLSILSLLARDIPLESVEEVCGQGDAALFGFLASGYL